MAGAVAIILPPPGGDGVPAQLLLRLLAGQPSRFRPVVFGPPDVVEVDGREFRGVEYRRVDAPWRLGSRAGRYAVAAAAMLRALRPTVIEVHDAPAIAAALGGRFRPVPVVLIVHGDPRTLPGAGDAAARTYVLAQATRVGALSPAGQSGMLEGVHPAMRHCVLLPAPGGPGGPGATADALDALRRDALGAWSRRLHPPI